jgi:hypothetical protein
VLISPKKIPCLLTREKEIVDLKKCQLIRLDANIVVLRFKNDIEFEEQDAKDAQNVLVNMFEDTYYLMLVDARDIFGTISHDARQFFAKDTRVLDKRKAEALLVNSTANYLIAKFYMQFHKPNNPIKVFKDYDKAIGWLENFRI